MKKIYLGWITLILLVLMGGCSSSSHKIKSKTIPKIETKTISKIKVETFPKIETKTISKIKVETFPTIEFKEYSHVNGNIFWSHDIKLIDKLYWQDQEINIVKKVTKAEAISYCSKLSIDGISDFRLMKTQEFRNYMGDRWKYFKKHKKSFFLYSHEKKKRWHNKNYVWALEKRDSLREEACTAVSYLGHAYAQAECHGIEPNEKAYIRCVAPIKTTDLDLILRTKIISNYGYPIIKNFHFNDKTKEFKINLSSTKGNFAHTSSLIVPSKDISKVKALLNNKSFRPKIKFKITNGKLTFSKIQNLSNLSSIEESEMSKQVRLRNQIEKKIQKMKLHKVKWKTLKKLLSGNTIINETNDIVMLLSKNLEESKAPAIVIDFSKRKVIDNSEWGTCMEWRYDYLCLGEIVRKDIVIGTPYHDTFKKYVFVNEDNTKFIIKNNRKGEDRYYDNLDAFDQIFNIIKGHPKKYIKLSQSKNFNHHKVKYITGRDLIAESIKDNASLINAIGQAVGKALSNLNDSTSWCYRIKNEDMKNSCIANTKNDTSWCYNIKNEDMKNSCIANTKNDTSWCYNIKNEDMKNSCIANTKNDTSWCYNIKNEDMKNSCIANTKNDTSWCYNIKNEDMKNSCIANTKK